VRKSDFFCNFAFLFTKFYFIMAIEVPFKDHAESKIAYLIALLRSMDFIENVKITPDVPLMPKKEVSIFDQFYGSIPELNVTEFETYLNESRNEWDRPLC
jgi:hypothetical protein